MSKIKTRALSERSLVIAQYALFLSLALAIPLFHSQYVTGPLVNAILFLAAALSGSIGAFFIAMIPSVVALSSGLLPAVLAPAVPFIMMGNAILVAVFIILKKKNFWLAAVSAGFAKFIFLFGSVQIVVKLIGAKPAAAAASSMLGYPQLITALAGGVIAWAVLKSLKRI
jgi:hypothetical protein